jgi:hypothetical protein
VHGVTPGAGAVPASARIIAHCPLGTGAIASALSTVVAARFTPAEVAAERALYGGDGMRIELARAGGPVANACFWTSATHHGIARYTVSVDVTRGGAVAPVVGGARASGFALPTSRLCTPRTIERSSACRLVAQADDASRRQITITVLVTDHAASRPARIEPLAAHLMRATQALVAQ